MHAPLGPEARALATTRQWLVIVVALLVVVFAAAMGIRSWSAIGTASQACILLALALTTAPIVLPQRTPVLWLSAAGILAIGLTPLVAPDGSPPWVPLPNAVANAGYIAILLAPRAVGPVVAAANAALLAVVIRADASSTVGAGLTVLDGWITVLQVLAAGLGLWWAWWVLSDEASVADREQVAREASTERAVAQRARARLWRAAATRVHESVLNSIRYVLSTDVIDTGRLAAALQEQPMLPGAELPADERSLSALVDSVMLDDGVHGRVLVVGPVPRLVLPAEAFEVARSALVELVRNAVRHGSATEVVLECSLVPGGQVQVSVTDDGSGLAPGTSRGIGLTTVVDDALVRLGGSCTLTAGRDRGTVATLCVPVQHQPRHRSRAFPPFDKARFLLSALLAASCVAGIGYAVALAAGRGPAAWPLVGVSIVAAVGSAAIVLRRRRLRTRLGLLLIAAPALTPWLALPLQLGCTDASGMAPVMNIAGFAVLVAAVWTSPAAATIGVAAWASGIIVLERTLPDSCRGELALPLLNALLIVPMLMAVSYAGIHAYQRAQDRISASRQQEIAERSRAEAETDLTVILHGAVEDALGLLGAVAAGAHVDAGMRHALETADSRIRAAIQVDPRSDGAMAVLARSLVEEVSTLGVRVQVRALTSSTDERPLPIRVQRLLYRALAAASEAAPVVQCFSTGDEDHLSVTVTRSALTAAGVAPGDAVEFDDVTVDVDEAVSDRTGRRFSVLVSRPVSPAGEAAADRGVSSR